MRLAELTWPDVEKINRDVVVVYPIAALEQHSRHLPFFTDAILCEAVAARLEAALPREVLLLPVQWLGASDHHLGMAGTLSASPGTFAGLLMDPLRCLLQAGFRRVCILNGHGGNIDGFHLALRQLAVEFPNALLAGASYWDFAAAEIVAMLEGNLKRVGHACEFETSMMMHLRPELVKNSEIADGDLLLNPELVRNVFIPLDMRRQTPQGGTGQPTKATSQKGEKLLNAVVASAVRHLQMIRNQPLSTGQP